MVLLSAAAEPAASPTLVRQVVSLLSLPVTAIDEAQESGLVTLRQQVQFRHPLIRNAVCEGAPASDLRDVHRAFARAIDRDLEPDRFLWHMAEAADGPDDELAEELEQEAHRVGSRGRYAARAALLTRAAALTPVPELRACRELAAAVAHHASGSLHEADRHLTLAEPGLGDPLLRAKAKRLRAALQSFTNPGAIPKILLTAARELEPLDARRARDTYAQALEACLVSCQFTQGTTPEQVAKAALDAPPVGDGTRGVVDFMLEGFAARFAVGYEEAKPALRKAIEILLAHKQGAFPFAYSSILPSNAAADLWDADSFEDMLRAMERVERQSGALNSLRITLGGLGHCAMWAGHFGQADAYHTEATDISRALGEDPIGWEILKVELVAWQGRDKDARDLAKITLGPFAREHGSGIVANLGGTAMVILNTAQTRYAEALEHARRLWETDSPPHGTQALPEVVESAVRCGQPELATDALKQLRERAEVSGTNWALGLLARSEAMVAGHVARAEGWFRESIYRLSGSRVITDRARAHLLYGEWLRRERRRMDARLQLRTAYQMFEEMGAAAFAERARRELAATGERARPRAVDTTNELTPQERQVAALAAAGQTNREIAASVYISANTVDYHLRKVYRKLSVSSRRQIRGALESTHR
jgi:DNA-binding CsgD family transcriptional regulator